MPQVQLNPALLNKNVAPILPHCSDCHDLTLALRQAKGRAGQETAPVEDAPTSSSSQLCLQPQQRNASHSTGLGEVINGNRTKTGTGERP